VVLGNNSARTMIFWQRCNGRLEKKPMKLDLEVFRLLFGKETSAQSWSLS
jgi:hypothetical protein